MKAKQVASVNYEVVCEYVQKLIGSSIINSTSITSMIYYYLMQSVMKIFLMNPHCNIIHAAT